MDITPDYAVWLSGYAARKSESEGVEQRIWAKALAIGADGDGPVVLITVENCGVPASVREQVARRLAASNGLSPERLAICSTHTHSAPMLTGVLPLLFSRRLPAAEQQRVARYTGELTEELVRVAQAALAARRPSRLEWAVGQVGFAHNRRRQGGPVDHSLPVLCVRGADGGPADRGRLRAILVKYSCHCTTLGGDFNRICGDWAGYAQEAMERDWPSAMALVAIGCGADANPQPRRELRHAKQHGEAIAAEVRRLLAGKLNPVSGHVRARMEWIDLPFAPLPTRQQWQKRASSRHRAIAYHAKVQLERLDRGQKLPTSLRYPVQTWTFGDDLAMVFLGGEVVVDYAVRLAREFDGSRLWVNAYANDVPCYIPSRRILKEGGYEADTSMVYYDRPTRFAPAVEDLIVDTVQRLLPHQFYSKQKQVEYPPCKRPAASLASFRPRPGMKVELVAAEPLVVDPVAIDFGIDGRLWVVEYLDYPCGMHGHYEPGGRIKFLTDRDGDGRYDTATVFLDRVPFPMGVMEWRDGVLIAAAPDIIYARDTDGDGRADTRQVLFTGFGTDNFQARVNGFRFGLDGWVHGSSGLRGGTIRCLKTGREVSVGSRDFRFEPDSGQLEPVAGGCQYMRTRDEWGNWFGNTNSVLLYHYPLPERYVGRNRHVRTPLPRVLVPTGGEQAHRVYPASHTLARFNNPMHFNRITSACGPEIYGDELLGKEFRGDAFVCEPVHNLVTRLELRPRGVTFSGQRAKDERGREFLASTDNWFRPAQVRTGPDGALWVVDMYRFVIEHPRWIGPDRLAKLDVRAGDDMGRIYRVYPAGKQPRAMRDLSHLPTAELAAAMDSPNGPLRDLIQRELMHRSDRSAVEPLQRVALKGRRPQARAQALCTLDCLGALEADVVQAALADRHPQVRRHAIRLSEPWLDRRPELLRAVIAQAADPDPTVRYQVAFSLGACHDAGAGRALGRIALRDASDPYIVAAVLSSAIPHLGRIVDVVLERAGQQHGPPSKLLEQLVSVAVAVNNQQALAQLLRPVALNQASGRVTAGQLRTLASVLDTLERRNLSLRRLHQRAEGPLRQAIDRLAPTFEAARRIASEEKANRTLRAVAISILGRGLTGRQQDLELLAELLGPRQPGAVQAAAVASLGRLRDAEVASLLLAGWRQHGPKLRSQVLDVLLRRRAWLDALLGALEQGRIAPADIDLAHRRRLLEHPDGQVRKRAASLLANSVNSDRQKVLAQYRAALTLTGDAQRGHELFVKHCAVCHRFRGEGYTVGPPLETLTDPTSDGILLAIIDPNQAVDPAYLEYAAATADGRVINGRLVNETATSITLLGQEDKKQVLLRSELEELACTGKSMMPEGLEQDLKPQDIADVMAYLNSGGPRPKLFADNHPQTIAANAKGNFVLLPQTAEIYGRTLVLAKPHKVPVLTQWRSQDDHACWRLQVERPGRYEIWLDWMCEEGSGGNRFAVELQRSAAGSGAAAGGQQGPEPIARLTGIATATVHEDVALRNWFRTRKVGEVELPAGPVRLTLRSAGPINSSLLDLRMLTLTPAGR